MLIRCCPKISLKTPLGGNTGSNPVGDANLFNIVSGSARIRYPGCRYRCPINRSDVFALLYSYSARVRRRLWAPPHNSVTESEKSLEAGAKWLCFAKRMFFGRYQQPRRNELKVENTGLACAFSRARRSA